MEGTMKVWEVKVREELAIARDRNAPINSLHEGYAVILEEFDELWEHVRKNAKYRHRPAVLAELVQIAAMCQRVAEDVVDGAVAEWANP